MSAVAIDPPKIQIPSNDSLYEIVDGELVEKPEMAAYCGWLAFILANAIQNFARPRGLGRAVTETLFHLNLPEDRNRRPDVAYISFERCPMGQLPPRDDNAWNVVPDLVAEVFSPSDDIQELQEKIGEYFRAGVRLVWVIFPRTSMIHIYQSYKSITVLGDGDTLDGGVVLPEFQMPAYNLFHEVA